MEKSEAFEFLELSEEASTEAIKKRWQEKYNHFHHIYNNAPTPQLKDIHQRNLDKLQAIRDLIVKEPVRNSRDTPMSKNVEIKEQPTASAYGDTPEDATALAFLVRHTEDKEPRIYPVRLGKNPIGRYAVQGRHSVVIDDDQYVSRYHAVINVYRKADAYYYEITDTGEFSNGRESRNGTFVNGSESKIERPVLLSELDTLQIGVTKLVFKLNTKPVEAIVKDVRKTQFMKTVLIADLM